MFNEILDGLTIPSLNVISSDNNDDNNFNYWVKCWVKRWICLTRTLSVIMGTNYLFSAEVAVSRARFQAEQKPLSFF